LEVGRDIPTPAEVKRLIEAAEDARRRALLLTAALTGLRASELRGAEICPACLSALLCLLVHQPKELGGRELQPKVVQQLLGHSSIVMTLDRYGHLFPRGDDRAEALARALLA
jgi:integrase